MSHRQRFSTMNCESHKLRQKRRPPGQEIPKEIKRRVDKNARSKKEGFDGPYTQENGFLAYFEICMMAKESSWIRGEDDGGNVYMHQGSKWVGFDSPEAIERKVG